MKIIDNVYFEIHTDETDTISKIRKNINSYYLSSNHYQNYFPINLDYGPVSIDTIINFLNYIQKKIKSPKLSNKKIIYYIYNDCESTYLLNSILLLGSFLIYYENKNVDDILNLFDYLLKSCPSFFIDCNNQDEKYCNSLKSCFVCINLLKNILNNISIQYSISYDIFDILNLRIIVVNNFNKINKIIKSQNINHIMYSKSNLEDIIDNTFQKYYIKTIDYNLIQEFKNIINNNKLILILYTCFDDISIMFCIFFIEQFNMNIEEAISCIRLFISGSLLPAQINKLRNLYQEKMNNL